MNFGEAIVSCFRRTFDFDGRSCRSEFWWSRLWYGVLIVVGFATDRTVFPSFRIGPYGPLVLMLWILFWLPLLALDVRRLHDLGRSGWNVLWELTIVGFIPLIYWWVALGEAKENRYGADPLAQSPAGAPARGAPEASPVLSAAAPIGSPIIPPIVEPSAPAPVQDAIPPLVDPQPATNGQSTAVPVSPRAPASAGAPVDLDLLEKLAALHRSGVLTDAEFTRQKSLLFGQG